LRTPTFDQQMETEADLCEARAIDKHMETEANLWEALPNNLLCSILARLPIRVLARMQVVCKRWNYLLSPGDALQRFDPNFSVNSIPGFFIQVYRGPENQESWVIELRDGVLDINIYQYPFPNYQIVMGASQRILLLL